MAIEKRAVYFYNAQKQLTAQGSLTYNSGTGKYLFSDTEATINKGEIGVTQLVIALPSGTFTGGAPFITIMDKKYWVSGLLPMSVASWTITVDTTDGTYQVFYITLGLVGLTFNAGLHAFSCGYLSSGTNYALGGASYTVQDGVNNYENMDSSLYDEIFTTVSSVFSDLASRMTAAEEDIDDLEAQDADFIDGTTTVKKAEQDAAGNVITTTYATKAECANFIPTSYLDTDGTLAANSDTKIATQKAVKTYADTKLPASYLDTDGTLNANSDTKVPSQKAVKTFVGTSITTHDDDTLAHEAIREDIEDLTRAVNRLDDRGISFGEVPYTTAQMTAFDSSTRATNIKNTIEAQSWWPSGTTYTPANGHYVYDTGVGGGAQFHEWEYNGSAWVDNGESTNVPATNSTLGLVKGDGTYVSITNGLIDVLIARKALALKDDSSSAEITYDTQKALNDQTTALEAQALRYNINVQGDGSETVTINTQVPSVSEAEQIADTAVQAITQINQDEALSRFSPPLVGTVTNSTEVTDTAQGFHAHTYSLKGQTFVQLVKNGNFVNTASWVAVSSTITVANNTLTATANGSADAFIAHQLISLATDTTYFLHVDFTSNKSAGDTIQFAVNNNYSNQQYFHNSATAVTSFNAIVTTTSAKDRLSFRLARSGSNFPNTVYFTLQNVQLVNLTSLGNIPGTSTAWTTLTASQVAAYLGNYDTNAEIVAKAIAGGEMNKVTNGTFVDSNSDGLANNWNITGGTATISNQFQIATGNTATTLRLFSDANVPFVLGKTYIIQCIFDNLLSGNFNISILDSAMTQMMSVLSTSTEPTGAYTIVFTFTGASGTYRLNFSSFLVTGVPATDYIKIKGLTLYDITDYFATSGIHSFTPELINVTDGTNERNLVVATIGNLNSLPDGSRDIFENTIQIDGERLMQITKKAHRLPLPYGTVGGNNIWSLRKVGTANTRFEMKIENFWTAYTPDMDATICYRATLPTNSGWSYVEDNATNSVFSYPLGITGLEQYAENAVPTIIIENFYPLGSYASVVESYTLGVCLNGASTHVLITVPFSVSDGDMGDFYTWLGSNPVNVVIPYDGYGTDLGNAYAFYFNRITADTFNAHCADTAGLTIYQDQSGQHFVSYKVANATADTLAELYTHLLANPITLVIPIVEAQFEHVISDYLTQYDESTFSVTSSTFVEPSAWELQYIKDLNKLISPAEDDLRFSAVLAKIGANNKPDFDFTNVGLLFPDNDEAEIAYIIAQMPHSWKEGTTIYPHVHARLTGAGQAIFKMDYKWYNYGEAPAGSFSTYVMNTNTSTWVSGTIATKINGTGGISGVGKTVSSVILIKLYRETTGNTYTGDILVDEFDIHYTVDKFGKDL